jgi:hypothetical protein
MSDCSYFENYLGIVAILILTLLLCSQLQYVSSSLGKISKTQVSVTDTAELSLTDISDVPDVLAVQSQADVIALTPLPLVALILSLMQQLPRKTHKAPLSSRPPPRD